MSMKPRGVLLAGAALATLLVATISRGDSMKPDSMPDSSFKAVHIERSASFHLPLPPSHALQLFTPEGERLWAHGWDPEYLYAGGTGPRPGMIFRTRSPAAPEHPQGAATLWTLVRYDTAAHVVEYLHIRPESRMGTVAVQCRPAAQGGTTVEVAYRLTGLSAEGNQALEEMSDEAFSGMMQHWETQITHRLHEGH